MKSKCLKKPQPLPLLLVAFLPVCKALHNSMQCHDGGYMHFCLSGPIYTSEPVKCSLAGGLVRLGNLVLHAFFLCLRIISAADRDTQLMVCAQLHGQAGAGLRAYECWSRAELPQLTPGLTWSQHWRGCNSAASFCRPAPQGPVWLCLRREQHPAPLCGRGSEQAHDGCLCSLLTCLSHRPENTSHS